jgi:pimeloyl-ACP methyl ester carboxylesterase
LNWLHKLIGFTGKALPNCPAGLLIEDEDQDNPMRAPRTIIAFITMIMPLVLVLNACAQGPSAMRRTEADRIAMPVFMYDRTIRTDQLNLHARERIRDKDKPVHVYIGGAGTAGLATETMRNTDDPTPDDPVALRMAAQDSHANVIYLARPCQYKRNHDQQGCALNYLGGGSFSNTVITTYMQALDDIKAYHDVEEFDLIGYSGGGGIAAILAARRYDVYSLRTVAGILDTKALTDTNANISLYRGTNPAGIADQLVNMPQHHFVGQKDEHITPAIFHSFAQAMGKRHCLNYSLLSKANHTIGWVERWQSLLDAPLGCAKLNEPLADENN